MLQLQHLLTGVLNLYHLVVLNLESSNSSPKCRVQPGDPGFPTESQLNIFNSSIDGRLLSIIPSGGICQTRPGGCSDAEWYSASWRSTIPGAVLQVNWEEVWSSILKIARTIDIERVRTIPQIPLHYVSATAPSADKETYQSLGLMRQLLHISSVRFAQTHNLKVAVKASGHDYLGRSTAKNSFLLWTREFQNIMFHDSFEVGDKNVGSAVTVGSGVTLRTLYQAAKKQGKIFVGGTAATVVAAGGYVQGAGHSALGPTFGLAADNALEFQVVIADGSLVTANEVSNPDLFWALCGGGAGSWGVIISTTFRVHPTFDAVYHVDIVVVNSITQVAQLAEEHARHIFDLDPLHAGQYFFATATPPTFTWSFVTLFPNTTIAAANTAISPFLNSVRALGFDVNTLVGMSPVNDVLSTAQDERGGIEVILGSRLWSSDVYRNKVTAIGTAYKTLFDSGIKNVLGHLVGGGQVSQNAHINNSVNPKWRTAKTHMVIASSWSDSTTPAEVAVIRSDMTQKHVPVLAEIAGSNSGAYSNEADVNEPNFQTTFFGPNYARLSKIKQIYDPDALFIVGAGVGSENWDSEGMCRLDQY
ncbi:hypothetical protein K439DRAFT_1419237 [Ramaria rubella]|nr:hypothetical protein K439DRAFT_1419237 [Ramaria rubella]